MYVHIFMYVRMHVCLLITYAKDKQDHYLKD